MGKIVKKGREYAKKKTESDYEEVETDQGLKCKIIEKVVYEKQKHIFPYSQWKYVSFMI